MNILLVVLALVSAHRPDRPNLDSLEALLPSMTVEKRIETLNDLSRAYVREAPDKSKDFATTALDLSEQADNHEQQVTALVNLHRNHA